MVFQSHALYPHMTERENMGFGRKVHNFPEADRRRRIERVGAPRDLYNRPASEFVADCIGAPSMNFLTVDLRDGQAMLDGHPLGAAPSGTATPGIRPGHLVLRPAGQGQVPATVSLTETPGGDAYLYVRLPGGQTLVVRAEGDTAPDLAAKEAEIRARFGPGEIAERAIVETRAKHVEGLRCRPA